jgi:lipoprotein-anchoring transpeptidase ErfK/SrfK
MIFKKTSRRPQACVNHSAVMTQVLWNFRSERQIDRKMPLSLYRHSSYGCRAGAGLTGRQNMETKRMNARIAAGLMLSATLGCGYVISDCADAKAQLFGDPDRNANPFQRLFGFGSSPIARTAVNFSGPYRPGNIVINTSERRLYLVTAPGQAIRYGIGVGRIGFTWAGTRTVSMKREWPDWTPPSQMLRRRPDLPRHMVGGIENPLGARAIYLGSSLYRIHGSNEPETIGQAVSSGCFRMTNEDVADLYDRVRVGAKVVVLR